MKHGLLAVLFAAVLACSSGVFAQAAPDPPELAESGAHYARGKELREQGSLEAARDEFQRAIELYPYSSWAVAELGRVELALGDTSAALEALNKAKAITQERNDLFVRVSGDLTGVPEAERREMLRRAIEGMGDRDGYYRLEIEYWAATHDTAAIAARCRADDVQNIVLYTMIPETADSGESNIRELGMWLLRTWIGACPNDWSMVQNYGRALLKQGDYEGAGPYLAAAYRNMRRGNTDIGYGQIDEFIALYQTHQYPEAFEYALADLRSHPTSVNSAYVAGLSAFWLDRYRRQIALIARAAEIDPKAMDDGVLLRLGIAHAALADYAEALDHFDRAVALGPSNASNRQWQLVAIYATGGKDQAIAGGSADGMSSYQVLELAYYGALDFAERSERAGAHYAALTNYALSLRALQDFYRASSIGTDWAAGEAARISSRIDQLYRGLRVKPAIAPEALAFVKQAEDAARRKNAQAAAAAYEQAIGLSPWSPELHYDHALALAGRFLNDLPWAIAEMERFLALAPGDPKTGDAQRQIVAWRGMMDRAVQSCGGHLGRDMTRTKGLAAPQLLIPPIEGC